jgi:hypothetical protein
VRHHRLVALAFLSIAGAGLLAAYLANAGSANPRIAAPSVLSSPVAAPGGNFTLGPIPEGYVPAVTADQAIAAGEAGAGVSAEMVLSIVPTLASFSWSAVPVDDTTDEPLGPPLYQDVPAWVLQVTGPCFVTSPTNPTVCVSREQNIVVDATTGEFIVGWSDFQGSTSASDS